MKHGSSRIVAVSAVALAALAAGCAHAIVSEQDRLMMAGRYGQLAQRMEGEIPDPSTAPTQQLFFLCAAYSKLKRYNKLFPCLDQLQANIDKGDRTFNFFDFSAVPLLLRAEAHMELGNHFQATAEGRKAYEIVEQRDLHRWSRIHALSRLALAHALHGDREAAGKYAQLLEGIGTHYPFNALETDKLTGLAKIYMALGEYQKSLDVVRQDEGGAFFRGLSDVVTGAALAGKTIWAFNQLPAEFILNKSLFETGHIGEATAGYDKLLAIPQTRDNGDIFWMILFDRGQIAEREGRLEEAIDFYRRAIDVIEQQRSTINTEVSKIGYVGDKQQAYRRVVAALFERGEHGRAFEYVERAKARALVDLLASKKDFAVPGDSPAQIARLISDLDAAEAEGRVQDAPPPAAGAGHRRAAGAQIKEQLQAVAPELASLVTVGPVSATDIAASVPPQDTLIEYYSAEEDLYAFVVTRDGLRAAKLDGAGLAQAVREYRAALEDVASRKHQEAGRRLYGRLLEPIVHGVKTPNITIVAHGVLHYVPFAALPAGDGNLVDRFSIRHLPSASVLRFLEGRDVRKATGLLALGNPDLGDPAYDLRHAQAEVLAISKDFPGAKVLVRKGATKAAFTALAGAFAYLHLATHGHFDPDEPLKSGLLLAGDRQTPGVLHLDELYSLRLNADLVTLSACETGLGKVHQGDDVVGLVRGFLYAGSNAVVASLWKVEDRATAHLMEEFYANLRDGTKREALRRAQLATKRQYEHPFFWAAFQLTGMGD